METAGGEEVWDVEQLEGGLGVANDVKIFPWMLLMPQSSFLVVDLTYEKYKSFFYFFVLFQVNISAITLKVRDLSLNKMSTVI